MTTLIAPIVLVTILAMASVLGYPLSEPVISRLVQIATITGLFAGSGMLVLMLATGKRHVPVEIGDWASDSRRLPVLAQASLRPALRAVRAAFVPAMRNHRRVRRPATCIASRATTASSCCTRSFCWAWCSPRWPARSKRCLSAGSWSASPPPCWWRSFRNDPRRFAMGCGSGRYIASPMPPC